MGTRTRSRMVALVRQWETSGETRRAFADRHGVTLSCFDYWRRQVLGAGRETAGFAPVRVIGDEMALPAGLIEVVLTNGERMLLRIRENLNWGEPRVQQVLDTALAFAVMNNHFEIADFLSHTEPISTRTGPMSPPASCMSWCGTRITKRCNSSSTGAST